MDCFSLASLLTIIRILKFRTELFIFPIYWLVGWLVGYSTDNSYVNSASQQPSLTFFLNSVANCPADRANFSLPVRGRSLLPYSHFELEESDYITGGRRNPELRGPRAAPPGSTLDPNTKVIEFKSCGVKVKNIK